jgi:hypothetical protein
MAIELRFDGLTRTRFGSCIDISAIPAPKPSITPKAAWPGLFLRLLEVLLGLTGSIFPAAPAVAVDDEPDGSCLDEVEAEDMEDRPLDLCGGFITKNIGVFNSF